MIVKRTCRAVKPGATTTKQKATNGEERDMREAIPRSVVVMLWAHRDPQYRNFEAPEDCKGSFENPNFRIGFEEYGYPHFAVYQGLDDLGRKAWFLTAVLGG